MTDFFVGQQVVCVDGSPGACGGPELFVGRVYAISELHPGVTDHTRGLKNQVCCIIAEISPIHLYGLWRFRPVEPKSAGLFRAIAADPSKFTFTPSKRERERVGQ